ncbi:hypothetical protein M0811_12445 [Anaeramoeba ignava]|uniref:BZIP domain-containing protein n=1 Tax=Anaeramoeba ignava TaxID=1746090 RepID=A0A9Q0R6G1_ANAIG|nr:hypothetical protein M0811_12445 [Anaeramoeba ignava]
MESFEEETQKIKRNYKKRKQTEKKEKEKEKKKTKKKTEIEPEIEIETEIQSQTTSSNKFRKKQKQRIEDLEKSAKEVQSKNIKLRTKLYVAEAERDMLATQLSTFQKFVSISLNSRDQEQQKIPNQSDK